MMEVDGYGLVHHESADEDLVLVARQFSNENRSPSTEL
jgi:hypothetical protein